MEPEYATPFTLYHPTRVMVVGASGTGKTEWVKKLILDRHKLFSPVPDKIFYTYKYWLPFFNEFSHIVTFMDTVPDETVLSPHRNNLCILDDILINKRAMQQAVELYTTGRHLQTSVILLTQNLYQNDASFRTCSLNSEIFVLLKSPRSTHQIMHLARDIFGKDKQAKFFNAYKRLTETAFSYIIIDLQPQQTLPLRSLIFSTDPYELVIII